MTYPQQYAPQGYGQPPQGYGQPPAQQYAPQQQSYPQPPAYAGPQQGQSIVPSAPQLRDGGGGGTPTPKMRHLLDRTIVVIPQRVDDSKKNDKGEPLPEAFFDLIVVDGGPLRFGDNQEDDPAKRRPNTHEIDTPCLFRNVNDYGFGFVQAVRDALAAGEPGRMGVVERSTQGRKPYLITRTAEHYGGAKRADGAARYAAAVVQFDRFWQAKHGGAPFVSPEPRSLVVAPPAGYAPQVAYGAPQGDPSRPYLPTAPVYTPGGQPQQYAPAQQGYQSVAPAGYAAQQYAQTGTVPTPYGAAPAAELHPAYVAAATQPTYAQEYAAQTAPGFQTPYAAAHPGTGPYGDGQPQSAPPAGSGPGGYFMPGDAAPAAPAPQAGPALPAPVEAWLASLPAEQAAMSRAQYIAQESARGGALAAAQPTGPGM